MYKIIVNKKTEILINKEVEDVLTTAKTLAGSYVGNMKIQDVKVFSITEKKTIYSYKG